MDTFRPFRFEKVLTHKQSGICFKTVVEDYLFCNAEGRTEATIYSYSYIAELSNEPDRPVLFCYNGGPGASSSWVHMGLLGPKQVTFPNYPGEDNSAVYGENTNFLLDCCDLVMINPPGTKYTYVSEKAGQKYFNFSVTYQNHGPYSTEAQSDTEFVAWQDGYTEEEYNIINNYLYWIDKTDDAIAHLYEYFL